ncbi:hypothetical protein V1517DRAFT_354593 [Lipomyces orientalis]|uniref:Uncharacterized protein n=1 Tax=Lipomyces orientalis TaxID=1233043 RepID=A0ACC3TGN1_9ASCO
MGFLYSQFLVTPKYPTESFAGQIIIVTGSNVGLGREAARHFSLLAVRHIASGEKAKQSIEESTGRTGVSFAERASKLPRIDVLLENAGIATRIFSLAENHERTITVNVISTFMLGLLLLPKLKATAKEIPTAKPHWTIVSSGVHAWTNLPEWKSSNTFEALDDEKNARMEVRYPTSKLLEVLVVREIAPRLADSGVILNMLNPGLCHSELAREEGWGLWFMKLVLARTTEVGSRTLVAAATVGDESHGAYMTDGKVNNAALGAFVTSEDGEKAQKKVWTELKGILEKIQPGTTSSF